MGIDLYIRQVTDRWRKEPMWTEMREEYEKEEMIPVDDISINFSGKPIISYVLKLRISYAYDRGLVEKEFQEQFNSTTKEPLSM